MERGAQVGGGGRVSVFSVGSDRGLGRGEGRGEGGWGQGKDRVLWLCEGMRGRGRFLEPMLCPD